MCTYRFVNIGIAFWWEGVRENLIYNKMIIMNVMVIMKLDFGHYSLEMLLGGLFSQATFK